MSGKLSYSERRLRKIAANTAKLQALGLGQAAAGFVKPAAPKKQQRRKRPRPLPSRKSSRPASLVAAARLATAQAERSPSANSRVDKPDDIFGNINGFPCGSVWEKRVEACHDLVHRATVAGIVGRPDVGCYSIVLNGGYPDDVDLGDAITFTGAGGHKRGSTGGHVVRDQMLFGVNAALATSIITTNPVRVLRGMRMHSKFAPLGKANGGTHNYRYDGLYTVVRKWQSTSLGSEALVWKFALTRVAGQPPLTTKAEERTACGVGEKKVVKKKKVKKATTSKKKKKKKSVGKKTGASSASAPLAWQTDPSAHSDLGAVVARRFSYEANVSRIVFGRVVGWVAAGRSKKSEPELFRIKHSDGDEEDLEWHELRAAKALAAKEGAFMIVDHVDHSALAMTACMICGESEPDESLLLCDGAKCTCAAHTGCLDPPLASIPSGDWFCPRCS